MRLGTDIIEIDRIEAAVLRNATFPSRILAPEELAMYEDYPHKRRMSFLAGRFSAKEAYSKAMGTGIGNKVKFTDICILPDEKGAPRIVKGPFVDGTHVSISHSRDYATATVIFEG